MSTQQYKINLRLPSHFDQIGREIKGMDDCIIQVGDTRIPCNRILLAKNSQWFRDYFAKHKKPGVQFREENAVVVPINDILPEYMQSFIDILYKNYLKINVINLPHLLKVAHFYKFPQISSILRTFYKDASQSNYTLMHFAKTFIENGLVDDAIALAPEITSHFIRAENHDQTETISIQDIYDALSPPVFAAVLIERRKKLEAELNVQVNDPQAQQAQQNTPESVNRSIRENLNKYVLQKEPTNDRLIIKYIEEFVKVKGVKTLTEDDKESLAKALVSRQNAEGLMAVSFKEDLINNDCDWVPARFYRFHVKRILDNRRSALRQFQKSIRKVGENETTNRWYVTSCVRNIKNAVKNPDPVPLIEFIRTLGGSVKPINPVDFGFIVIDSTKPMIDSRKAQNVFVQDPTQYFISQNDGKKKGFIKFDIGDNVFFKPSRIYIDSRAYFKRHELNSKDQKNSVKLDYRGHISSLKMTISKNGATESRDFNIPEPAKPYEIDFPLRDHLFSSATFEVNATDKGSDIFRITTLEIMGDFELK